MHPMLEELSRGVAFTGDVRQDMARFLAHHGCPRTAGHCLQVGAEARRVAKRVGANGDQAELAGWLHDVSAIWPAAERVAAARTLGVDVLPEEERVPLIIHQKLSVVLAREVFGVRDPAVLSAIGCHTTLKAGASVLDKVLFVADKIEWDQEGTPPYLAGLLAAFDRGGLDAAALHYIHHLVFESGRLQVVHPWLRGAYEELSGRALTP